MLAIRDHSTRDAPGFAEVSMPSIATPVKTRKARPSREVGKASPSFIRRLSSQSAPKPSSSRPEHDTRIAQMAAAAEDVQAGADGECGEHEGFQVVERDDQQGGADQQRDRQEGHRARGVPGQAHRRVDRQRDPEYGAQDHAGAGAAEDGPAAGDRAFDRVHASLVLSPGSGRRLSSFACVGSGSVSVEAATPGRESGRRADPETGDGRHHRPQRPAGVGGPDPKDQPGGEGSGETAEKTTR
jgi:hypothetical protein